MTEAPRSTFLATQSTIHRERGTVGDPPARKWTRQQPGSHQHASAPPHEEPPIRRATNTSNDTASASDRGRCLIHAMHACTAATRPLRNVTHCNIFNSVNIIMDAVIVINNFNGQTNESRIGLNLK